MLIFGLFGIAATSSSNTLQAEIPLAFTINAGGKSSTVLQFPSGQRHVIEINLAASLTLIPRNISCDPERFASELAELRGSVRIWGAATTEGGGLETRVLEIPKVQHEVSRTSSNTSSRFTPNGGDYLYMITRDAIYVPPDEIKVYAFEYVSSLEVLRVWIALKSPFVYDAEYEHYDFPATHTVSNPSGTQREIKFREATSRTPDGDVLWEENAKSGECLKVVWRVSPNGNYYDFIYEAPDGSPAKHIGYCHFEHGVNGAFYWTLNASTDLTPDFFTRTAWFSIDGGENDIKYNGDRYLDWYEHYYDVCRKKYSIIHNQYYYKRGCNPISNTDPGSNYAEWKPGCDPRGFTLYKSTPTYPTLAPEANAFFSGLLAELDEFPQPGSVMRNWSMKICDIDGDGDCDRVDHDLVHSALGSCRDDLGYSHFMDIDGDMCVTEFDLASIFQIGPVQISFTECISELCVSYIEVTAEDPSGGNLTYTWEAPSGGHIVGGGQNVVFVPHEKDPHPCPYEILVTLTSDVSGLSSSRSIQIYVKLAGDMNGDGNVDTRDLVELSDRYLESGLPGWTDADVNCDGFVDALDAAKVASPPTDMVEGCICP